MAMPGEQYVSGIRSRTPGERGTEERSIRPCNFRAAGRISNENGRLLTEIHQTFAHHLGTALDVQLGTGVDAKVQGLEQFAIKDYLATIAPFAYLASAGFQNTPGIALIQCDVSLIFPIIDLLLGGTTVGVTEQRELSEIEEELMHDVAVLIARKAEAAWRLPSGSFTGCQRIRSTYLHHVFPPNERLAVVRFEMEILNVAGSFQLVLPTSFVNGLLKQSRSDPARRKQGLRRFPAVSIRERMLDADFTVSAELPPMRVPVRELVSLAPGSVLKLRAPVDMPGVLTVSGTPMFEAMPVRSGATKAAQLVRPVTVAPRKA